MKIEVGSVSCSSYEHCRGETKEGRRVLPDIKNQDSIHSHSSMSNKRSYNAYIYARPPKKTLCFDIAVKETRQTQQKHVHAILSVEKHTVMARGLFTATGKSCIRQGMVDRNCKVFICPTNILLQEFD